MKKLTLITAIILTANLMFAQIINIPNDYPTIQQGINAASDSDTVLVQPGTYFENVNFGSKSLTLASLYLTTQDTSYISQTIIDGGQEGNVIYAQLWEQGDIEISIAGFTIQNGTANNSVGGGGICINWVNINPEPNNIKLSNLIIRDNFVLDNGGGVYIGCDDWGFGVDSASNVYIKDVLIRENISYSGLGGGIYCENIDPALENVVIEKNVVYYGYHAGRGGYFYQTKPRFQNVRVISNPGLFKMNESHVKSIKGPVAEQALVFDHSSPLLQNVLIADNYLGGLYLRNSEAVIHNSTFTYESQGAIWCDSSSVTLINSIMWGNGNSYSTPIQMTLKNGSTCSVLNCDIQDGIDGIGGDPGSLQLLQWLEGNISDDPLFDNTGDSTYQLSSASPCIDAGTPDTMGLNLPCWDLMGNIRIWDGDGNGAATVDMGAHEFGAIPVGIVEEEVRSFPEGMPLAEVRSYPNPVSENCLIEFDLAKPSRVSIQLYNNMGELLIEPKNQICSTGQHQVNLNLIDLKDGIYFCRVQIGNEMVTKKIMKL